MTHRIRRVGHIQMCNAFYQILWRSWACIKMQTLETFSVITVQVRIFSGLDRNDLMYSLRICEIFLFMNASLIFSHLSCIRHLVCDMSFGHIRRSLRYLWTSATRKNKSKKERDPELNSVPSRPE